MNPLLIIALVLLWGLGGCSSSNPPVGHGGIKGVVQDSKARPLANLPITIVHTTAKESLSDRAPLTNEKGEFLYPDLPEGVYTLQCSTAEGKSQQAEVQVIANKITHTQIEIR